MKRKITDMAAGWTAVKMDGFADDPAKWLSQKMEAHHLESEGTKADEDDPVKRLFQKMPADKPKYLLAHADDGVIWGRFKDQQLITSYDVAPKHSPPLLTKTLQTARLFAPAGELLIWRDEAGEWAGRLITEITKPDTANEQASQPSTEPAQPAPTVEWTKAFDEYQILLGTNVERRDRGFTLMSEGSQGLFHAVPLNFTGQISEQIRPLQLVVRHYLKADEYGFLRVNASRLFNLLPEPKESNT